MDDRLPPKAVNVQARRLQPGEIDPASDLTPVRQSSDLQRSVKGMPVLEAFQRFLETERRRARNRMIFLTVIFVIILLMAGVIIGNRVYRHMQADVKDVRSQIQDVQGTAQQFSRAAVMKMSELSSSAADRDGAFEKQAEASQTRMNSYDDSLGTMRDKVEKLEARNTTLLEELDDVHDVLPDLSTDMRMLIEIIHEMRPVQPERALPRTYDTLSMMIQPEGIETVVPWRLPIQE